MVVLCSPAARLSAQGTEEEQQLSEAGQQALTSGHYDEAERNFTKLAELDPQIAEIHATLGLVYFQEKKFEQAVPELRRALKLKPTLGKASTLLAMSLSIIA